MSKKTFYKNNRRSIKDVPLDVIERGLKDSDCDVRQAAMNACQGKDVPLDVIKRWLKDSDWRVRQAAVRYCEQRGIEIPVIRTIEPPKKVYKKCLNNVIVVAEIPYDAEVRGRYDGKCRANKAKIIDIIGDEVVIEDFDKSFEECSTGFHFFCTREQAENYN